jgi:hypothetical protein
MGLQENLHHITLKIAVASLPAKPKLVHTTRTKAAAVITLCPCHSQGIIPLPL